MHLLGDAWLGVGRGGAGGFGIRGFAAGWVITQPVANTMPPVSSASAVDKQACRAEVRRHRSNDALVKIASSWAALSLVTTAWSVRAGGFTELWPASFPRPCTQIYLYSEMIIFGGSARIYQT